MSTAFFRCCLVGGLSADFCLRIRQARSEAFDAKKGLPDANRPWSDEERHIVLQELPEHIRLAIAL